MNCRCLSCDMQNLTEDDILTVAFETDEGNIIQSTELFVKEVKDLLARWIVE